MPRPRQLHLAGFPVPAAYPPQGPSVSPAAAMAVWDFPQQAAGWVGKDSCSGSATRALLLIHLLSPLRPRRQEIGHRHDQAPPPSNLGSATARPLQPNPVSCIRAIPAPFPGRKIRVQMAPFRNFIQVQSCICMAPYFTYSGPVR